MRVILFILKCLVGLFATVGFLIVLVGVGLGLAARQWDPERPRAEIPENAVLTMDFSGGIVETLPDNPLSRASLRQAVVLRDTVEVLAAAAEDDRVKGLVAKVGRGPLGIAQIQEVRDAVMAFRASGKFTYAFAESFGEGGDGTRHYYLASAFEQVYMQPSGDLDLTGLMIQSPFLRDALNEIGVEPQLAQREEFKGAMNTFTDDGLPEPQRQNLKQLVDSLLAQIARGIAEGRDLAPARVRALIDRGPYMAQAAVEAGLVDGLQYWDQVNERIDETAGADAEFVSLSGYNRARETITPEGPSVALIYGLGPVQLAESENDPAFGSVVMGSDTVSRALSDAIDDDEIEAILFRVDSPGGSYVASDTIWREMQRARDLGKPVIVSMGGLAASGGYFVSAPAHKIVALPGTVTGSIGVVAGKMVLKGLWEKIGVSWDGVQAGQNAGIWNMNEPFGDAEWARLNRRLDLTYADFTNKVAMGRGMDQAAVLEVAKGKVWTGEDAQGVGLVDELGGLNRAIALAAEAIDADPASLQLKELPERRDPWSALVEDTLGDALGDVGLTGFLRAASRLSQALAPLAALDERLRGDPRAQTLRAPDIGLGESRAF